MYEVPISVIVCSWVFIKLSQCQAIQILCPPDIAPRVPLIIDTINNYFFHIFCIFEGLYCIPFPFLVFNITLSWDSYINSPNMVLFRDSNACCIMFQVLISLNFKITYKFCSIIFSETVISCFQYSYYF